MAPGASEFDALVSEGNWVYFIPSASGAASFITAATGVGISSLLGFSKLISISMGVYYKSDSY